MSSSSLTSLGRYRIVRTLARGAMGVVYEAVDTRLGRTVAIKTVLKTHLDDEATAHQFALRFEREAQAAARMAHPNIVTVHDFGEHDGELSYIVMEYVRGRELASLFKGGQAFTVAEAARIIGQLLDALAYAHERGVVHRDVKPANVMIDESGQVKLADFGVARLAGGTLERTMPGTIVGTPNYMAPEQILGQSVGSRADLFAAGVLLYQCLTGVQPFAGGGMFEVQRRILQEDPPPPTSLRPELPAALDAVVARALAKRPDDRYDSAASFAADLRRVAAAAAPAPGAVAAAADDDATVLLTVPAPGAWDPTLPGPPPLAGNGAAAATRPPSIPGTARSQPGTLPSRPGTAPPRPGTWPSQPGTAPPAVADSVAVQGMATGPEAGRGAAAAAPVAPTTGAPRRAASPSLLVWLAVGAAGAAIVWWTLRPPPAAPGGGGAAVTAPMSSPAPATPSPPAAPANVAPAPAEAPAAGSQPSAADAVATPTPAPLPAPAPRPAETPATPAPPPPSVAPAPRAAPAPEPAPARPAPQAAPRSAPPRAVTPAPAPAARCTELLERMQLGEPLTPEQSTYFQSRCTR